MALEKLTIVKSVFDVFFFILNGFIMFYYYC